MAIKPHLEVSLFSNEKLENEINVNRKDCKGTRHEVLVGYVVHDFI